MDSEISRRRLEVRPRYHRWYVDPGVEWVETNTGYANLDWSIPLSQTALVLVDVWEGFYLGDTKVREEAVIDNAFVPLLASCRRAGMPVIHAPSPPMAKRHPNWVRLVDESEVPVPDNWPPPQFRDNHGPYPGGKSSPYQAYNRPKEPRAAELEKIADAYTIHPKVQPVGKEPVIATGEELHRYCKQQGILFLFYAGFYTNACVIVRDYGTLAMYDRGYEVILVRDCTTGMESRETHPTLGQTHWATLFLEMFGKYSVPSREIIFSLEPV